MPEEPKEEEKPVEKKDELLRELSDVEQQAQRLETFGQDVVRSARLSRDVVPPIRDIVSRLPSGALSPDDWDRQIEGWRSWKAGASELEKFDTAANSFAALSFAGTNTSTQAFLAIYEARYPEIEAAASRLHQVFERFPLSGQARSSMQRLGLATRAGDYRTPLELFNDAQAALERPASRAVAPASVLIPLRECIDSAISELLRRRPQQEPAGRLREKLMSIGRQCARPGLHGPHFERLAADGEALNRDLSSAKQAEMSREQLNKQFHRGLLFLNALLDSIDESRLR
jgi:hypothetical protein